MKLGWIAIGLAALAALGLSVIWALQRRMVFPRPAVARDPETGEVVRAPGTLFVWMAPDQDDAPVVVHFHGNGGQVADEVTLGRWVAATGAGFAAVEYPGYGLLEGSPSEESLLASARAALQHLTGPMGVAPERIVLCGQSMGSGVAMAMAGEGWGSRVLLVSPFTSLPEVASGLFRGLPLRPLMRDRLDNLRRTGKVHQPLLILHGEQDTLIPPSHSVELVRAMPQAQLELLEGAGHNDLWQHPRATPLAARFLRWGPGRHGDQGVNGLWMRRIWLHESRSEAEIQQMVRDLHERGITWLYPFLGPLGPEGRPGWRDGDTIRPYDPDLARAFFTAAHAAAPGAVILPWTGGVLNRDVQLDDPAFRARFAAAMAEIVALGADGVQINVEPMPSGHPGYLALLDAVREAIGPDRVLSLAAYPPSTPLHPYPDVHWDLAFTAELCHRVDEMAFMAYDTALADRDTYAGLVSDWTDQLADTLPPPSEGGCIWRMGLPAYEDDEPWHRPDVETLSTAIRGVNTALLRRPVPEGFRGVALYASWTLDEAEWATYNQEWRLNPPLQPFLLQERPAADSTLK